MKKLSSLIRAQRLVQKDIEEHLAIQVIEQHLEVKYKNVLDNFEGPHGDSDLGVYYSIDFNGPNQYSWSPEANGSTSVYIPFELLDECNIEEIIKLIDHQMKDHLPETKNEN